MPLTDLSLRAFPFQDGQRDYVDSAVSGLFIRVGKKTKTFMLTLKQGGKRQRMALGHYPDLSLSKARERARDLLAEARIKKDERSALTFNAAREQFFRLHVPAMRASTQRQVTRILHTRFTVLDFRQLTDLKTSELAATLDAIRSPSEKRNAHIWLKTFLNWCYSRGYLDQNPISRLKGAGSSQIREHVLSDQDLVKVWSASSEDNFGAFVRLLILTAQRKGQWYTFRPEFIQGDTIVWPKGFMKSARAHSIPLTPTIARTIGNHSFQNWNEAKRKEKLLKASQTSGWTLHDLRRTTATRMAEMGIGPHIVERLLAHSMPGVAARYNRASYLPEMRDAIQKWETRIQALLQTTEGNHAGYCSRRD